MTEKLMTDEWDEAYRMGVEAMRAACIAAVNDYLNDTPTEPQMEEWQAKFGDEWFQEALLAVLREVQT